MRQRCCLRYFLVVGSCPYNDKLAVVSGEPCLLACNAKVVRKVVELDVDARLVVFNLIEKGFHDIQMGLPQCLGAIVGDSTCFAVAVDHAGASAAAKQPSP